MANTCFLYINCVFDSEEWAGRYGEIMTTLCKEAQSKNRLAYMGDTHRYLGDADIQTDGNEVNITGWTKWSLDHEEAIHVIGFVKNMTLNHLLQMTISYSETSDNIYGVYTYTRGVERPDGTIDELDGKIVDKYIESENWPDIDWDDDDKCTVTLGDRTWDDEDDALEAILAEFGKEEVVSECI